jgi:hypothetical protein
VCELNYLHHGKLGRLLHDEKPADIAVYTFVPTNELDAFISAKTRRNLAFPHTFLISCTGRKTYTNKEKLITSPHITYEGN